MRRFKRANRPHANLSTAGLNHTQNESLQSKVGDLYSFDNKEQISIKNAEPFSNDVPPIKESKLGKREKKKR